MAGSFPDRRKKKRFFPIGLLDFQNMQKRCVAFDVQEIDKIADLPSTLPPSHQEVDILVNNAGLALGTASADTNNMSEVMRSKIDQKKIH